MEHVTDIDKKAYLDDCIKVVKELISKENIELSEHEYVLLTKEIMDTSLMMGGDYSKESIEGVTNQYIQNQFLPRFLKTHR